ncbi:hypothetical protein N657DRAFT_329593 [Parathielavia appendiculata]|uniref:Uncharacterized protein n=1 Tax=Parathielavia appendiculata TaxID=2587402 RepID=A0AAN6TQA3_9PEZI|nr:hypothetical protein N657DRAFT_329593 [Parathielavia appendiculata]
MTWIDICHFLFEATKLFDNFRWRDERIIDTSSLFISILKTNFLFGYGVPASKDGGCGFFLRLQRNGRFLGGFASSSSQLFASVSAEFVGFAFHLDTIYLVFRASLFFVITEAAISLIITIKSSNGSRVNELERKRISTYRTTCDGWERGAVCFLGCWCFSILLGGYMGEHLGVGRIGKDIVRFLLGNLSELVFPNRFTWWAPD